MKRRRKQKSIYSARKSRKPIRHPSLLFFAAVLALGLVMASAFALPGDTFTVDDATYNCSLTYEVLTEPDANGEGGTVELIQYEGTSPVTIPEVVERPATDDDGGTTRTYTVTVIGNRLDGVNPVGAFEGATSISVTLPDSIRQIKDRAFRDMTTLSSLTGLSSNTSVEIAEGAFHGCCFLPESHLPDDESRNPNPFGDDVISGLKVELRGITACTWHHDNYTSNRAPERLFRDMSEKISVYVGAADGYNLKSLQRISSGYGTDLLPAADYAIEFDNDVTSYYWLPACETEEDGNAWEERPVIAIIAVKQGGEEGIVPTITTNSQLSASTDIEVQLEADNLNNEGQWIFPYSNTPAGLTLDERTGKLSGSLDAGTYVFTVRALNGHSFHDKVFTLTVSGDGTEDPDPPSAEPLPAPQGLEWDASLSAIKAVWDPANNADGYIVQLYKDGAAIGEPIRVGYSIAPSYDFADTIRASGEGNYSFSVISVSNKTAYTNSEPAMSRDYIYTVDTPARQYTITASAGAGGSITPSGEVRVEEGGVQTFIVTTDKYYQLVSLIVDGTDLGRRASYTFSDVTSDHEIRAVFRAVSNRVGDMATSYPAGKDITFTAYGDGMDNHSPAAGDIRWQPLSWNLNGENTVYFGEGEITGIIGASDLTVGTHTIQITYVMQEFNGTEWVDVEGVDYDTREMTFEVEESSDEETTPENDASDSEKDDSTGEGDNDPAEGSGDDSSTVTKITDTVANYFTNPQTGQLLPARVILAAALLVLTGSAAILLPGKKTRKTSASRRR